MGLGAVLLGSQVPRYNITPAPKGFTTADALDAVDFAAGGVRGSGAGQFPIAATDAASGRSLL